jgi:hypothetical protein
MLTSRLHLETPALAPTIIKVLRRAGVVLCIVLVVAALVTFRAVVYGHFHGDDSPWKALVILFGS